MNDLNAQLVVRGHEALRARPHAAESGSRWICAAFASRSAARRRAVGGVVLFVATLFLSVACDPDLPPITWEGEHIRFANGRGIEPYGATLEQLDKAVGRLERALNTSLPPGVKITYYWLEDDEAIENCWPLRGIPVTSCAHDFSVVSNQLIHKHELLHIVSNVWDPMPEVFSEGIPMHFSENSDAFKLLEDPANRVLDALRVDLPDSEMDYAVGGFFVGYLKNKYGLDKLKQVVALSRVESGEREYDGILKYVIGVSLDEMILDISKITKDQQRCFSPELQTEDLLIERVIVPPDVISIPINESSHYVIGPFGAEEGSEAVKYKTNARLKIEEDANYNFGALDTEAKGYLIIRPLTCCGDCEYAERYIFFMNKPGETVDENSALVFLQRGEYQLEFLIYNEGALRLSIDATERTEPKW